MVVLYGASPRPGDEWPIVGWLVLDDGEGARVTHRLATSFRIADDAEADVRISGMIGGCVISSGLDGFSLRADDGATPRLNGAVVHRVALVDNDVIEIDDARLVFKCTA